MHIQRDEEPSLSLSELAHGTAAIPAATLSPSPPPSLCRSSSPPSLRGAAETGETYIFSLYTLFPALIPFSRLQHFQIHVIKLAAGSASLLAHAKYIYTDR